MNGEKSQATSYLLWFCCLFIVCGLHRFYLGRPWTGLLWLLTGGLLGIGQIIDLFLIPGMVREQNMQGRLAGYENDRLRR